MKQILKGNLTKNPVIATTKTGKEFAKFTVVENKYKKTADGQFEETGREFQFCTAYGVNAEIAKTLEKGQQVTVTGYVNVVNGTTGEFTILNITEIVPSFKAGERKTAVETTEPAHTAPAAEAASAEAAPAEATAPKVKRGRKKAA